MKLTHVFVNYSQQNEVNGSLSKMNCFLMQQRVEQLMHI